MLKFLSLIFCFGLLYGEGPVLLGVDCFFQQEQHEMVRGKKIGLIVNQTSLNSHLEKTVDLFKKHFGKNLVALFCPEHGINGEVHAGKVVHHGKTSDNLSVYSLHGQTRRPTEEMLKNIDVLVYDIQDIGVRSYTYVSTLCYVIEEAAKTHIPVIILDRPNPINGVLIDGPMLQNSFRSFIGYINVPYCHGMTIGELARFFNEEYKIGCHLKVIPMRGWNRKMSFEETSLPWIPTSPNIPESTTPLFCASTGILGELGIVNIGVGYTQPFKVVGAPWINAIKFAEALNAQNLPGVKFLSYHFKPFYGLYKNEVCNGIKIMITDPSLYRPLSVQYMLMGVLKALYPKIIDHSISAIHPSRKKLFCQANGNEEMLQWLTKEKYVAWKMIQFDEQDRKAFEKKRLPYLLY